MRTSLAVLGSATVLFIGYIGLNRQASAVYDASVTNGNSQTSAAYNVSVNVFNGLGTTAGPAVVWAGVAAFILVTLGVLYMAVGGGR